MKKVIQTLSLFTSFSTLICCALPALLVTLGLGASLAGFLSKYPELIVLSENKNWIFIIGGVLLGVGYVLKKKSKSMECPIDEKKEACMETKKTTDWLFVFSVLLYAIGFSFAYLLPFFLS